MAPFSAGRPSGGSGSGSMPTQSVDELQDEIDMQRILIDSLAGTSADTPSRRAEMQNELDELERKLNMALRSRASLQAPPNHGSMRDTGSGYANTGDQSRKRTFSVHNGDTFDRSHANTSKSQRTTPSPNDSEFAGNVASSPIDLSNVTATGQEFLRRQKAEAERLRRRREQEERDAAFARSLQADIAEVPSSSSQIPGNSQTNGPNAFDRIRQPIFSQSSQRNLESGGATLSPQRALPTHSRLDSPQLANNLARPASAANVTKPSKMPGSFDSDGEGFWSDDDAGSNSHEFVDLTETAGPSSLASGSRSWNAYQPPNAHARETAFRQQQQSQSGFAPYSGGDSPFLGIPPAPVRPVPPGASVYGSGRGFNNIGTPINFQHDVWMGMGRPGSLVGGSSNPLDPMMPGRSYGYHGAGSTLANIIDRTANIDYANGLDMFGHPLDERLRDYIHDVVDDPRKNEEEIRELLANIRPDMDIPVEDREDDPVALRYPLYPHQRVALKWMVGQEEDAKKQGGILADDMGLGKTISTLSLIVSRQAQPAPGQRTIKAKTNLIVGPVGLIRQWEREIAKKLKTTHRLSVFLAHGKKATYEDLRTFDIVLTSYGTLGSELSKRDRYVGVQHKNGNTVDNATLDKLCPMLGPNSLWYRVILDEAQCIKNSKTWAAKAACELKAQHRWCLSGTPMMNSVNELSSLIQFLRIKPYDNPKKFSAAFGSLTPSRSNRSSASNRDAAMTRLQALLKAIMLRRTKTSKLNGNPIIQLTAKHEETVHVVFNEDENKFYRDLEQNSQVQFSKYLKNGTVGKHYTNILALLTRLRQACCHPLLHMLDFSQVNNGSGEVSEIDMKRLAESFAPEVVKRIRETEDFECPICMDAVQNPSIFVPCGHDTCSECLVCLATGSSERGIQAGNENAKASCPECRGAIDFQKVITLEIFKQVHMPETIKPEPSTSSGGIDADATEDDSGSETASDGDDDDNDDGSSTASDDDEDETDDDDVDDKGNLKDFIVADNVDDDFIADDSDVKDEKDSDTESELGDIASLLAKQDKGKSAEASSSKRKTSKKAKLRRRSKRKGKRKDKGKGKEKEEPVQPHMLRQLRQEAGKNREAHRRYMRYLKEIWEPSAKVTKCMELVADIQKTNEKTIIFSQWTLLLDLLETPLKHELGIGYRRYDGSMSAKQRDAAASDFMERSDVKVILVSLKAGNAGLNLTAASQVIIMDPFWNPYIEMQAVDRAHRIGQQRDVKVHRILVENTIEDRIVDLQNKKREFVDAALSEEASKNIGRLTTKDLTYLFGIGTGSAPQASLATQ